jgi:hypothetical protein
MIDFIYAYLLVGLGFVLPVAVTLRDEKDGDATKMVLYWMAVLLWPIVAFITIKDGEIK